MSALDHTLAYARQYIPRFLDELKGLCAIPSISSLPEYKTEMQRSVEYVGGLLRTAGLENVQILPTEGHPVRVGEWLNAGQNRPTVLFYGHYDVQPALDLDAWHSHPFHPEVRGENLYGRGASDMKGQVMAEIAAVQAWIEAGGGLPVNVKFLIEGEEEIGSKHLRAFIRDHKELLACNVVFNPDAGMAAPDLPSITYSLRGGMSLRLRVYGPQRDLHSGTYGGTVHNPTQALVELLSGMHDAQGRVTIPGFYERVRHLDHAEREEMARMPYSEDFFLKETGAPTLWGEPGFTPYERTTARPTLEILSLHGGMPGEGVLNIVPAYAEAALSTRLVPDQDPKEIYNAILKYIEFRLPPTVRWEAHYVGGGFASLTDRNSSAVQAMRRAQQATWGVEPAFLRVGGGIPVVAQLREEMGLDSLLTGFGLMDDNAHGPNEKLHLPTWEKGIEATVRFLDEYRQG